MAEQRLPVRAAQSGLLNPSQAYCRACTRGGVAVRQASRPCPVPAAGCCRQQAAGDQLRVVYAQLSQDPNSLANLDQDLPNYAQHQVPIHSLPQVLQPLQTGFRI